MASEYRASVCTIRHDRTSRKGENNMGIPVSELKGCSLAEMKIVARRYGYEFLKAHDGLVEFTKIG